MSRNVASKFPLVPVLILVAAAALVILTVVLDAWLDDAAWTEATAAAGLAATVVAAGVLLATAQGWANGRRLSLAALATAVVGLGAIGLTVVTYVGGSAGDTGITSSNEARMSEVAGTETHASQKTTDEGIALSEQVSNNEVQPPGYAHDPGAHPTYSQFMSLDTPTVLRSVPGGSLTPPEVAELQAQLSQARGFAEQHNTVEKAEAAGYFNTTNDVPYMGAHFLNMGYVLDGKFDPSKPEGLLFSKLGAGDDAPWQLVGVWYLLFPGVNGGVTETIPPPGFAGNLDLWHEHHGLCTRAGIISENNTHQGCVADQGRWIGDLRWMMHVWIWPETAENPEGVFTYLNADLAEKQQVTGGPGFGR